MKPTMLCAGVALMALLSASPAMAVSEDVRRACLIEAYDVRPQLNAPQIEAYVANCIADAAATPRLRRQR